MGTSVGDRNETRQTTPSLSGDLAPRKKDAIHRALLTGLLGNVGVRHDDGEYNGVRGKKFHLFPGSSLFRQRPSWVMAAELVETTKLYARTVAPVNPIWVEHAAAHMVKRTLTDPHWRPDIGRVLAFERVALHGLTLVPRRKVHFGPIEPRLSREIFIHHALVLGEYESRAPFFIHNRDLIREVQTLEAKARRRDVLVDHQARFTFYDAHIPQRIYTADEFEKWRRAAEKHNPRLLFMSRRDIMLHPALGVTGELYPDSIEVAGVSYPLEYRFEPGDSADGITVSVPLAAIDRFPSEPFRWLVPGFRFDLFVALIRSLPKSLRVKFVPAPDYATRAARDLMRSTGPLLDAFARYLGKLSGELIQAEDFQADLIPEYLRMNFAVVDLAGTVIATGRDLGVIRRRLGMEARARFAVSPPPQYHQDGLTRWEIGDLPERAEIAHEGLTLNGYPALVDAGSSVSLRLFDKSDLASQAMRGGLRKLFMLQVRQELQFIEQSIPAIERLCLYYATIGRCDDLNDDLITAIADRAFFGDDPSVDIRTQQAFADRSGIAWQRLSSAANEIVTVVAGILEQYQALNISLDNEFPPLWNDSIRDMRDQLAHLVYRGFVIHTPFEWLLHVPRYLQGIDLRLKKLANAGLNRDIQAMAEARPLWEMYKLRAFRHQEQGIRDAALEHYRWMLEELRVSLFVQELKAVIPVSEERLRRQWAQVGK
jgi:ATP-dependent helicase HrpA